MDYIFNRSVHIQPIEPWNIRIFACYQGSHRLELHRSSFRLILGLLLLALDGLPDKMFWSYVFSSLYLKPCDLDLIFRLKRFLRWGQRIATINPCSFWLKSRKVQVLGTVDGELRVLGFRAVSNTCDFTYNDAFRAFNRPYQVDRQVGRRAISNLLVRVGVSLADQLARGDASVGTIDGILGLTDHLLDTSFSALNWHNYLISWT